MEFEILDFLQTIRAPLLDSVMVFTSSLGNAGMIWILLAAVLLILPKYRKAGMVVTAALVLNLILCNIGIKPLVERPRPCDIRPEMLELIPRPHGWSFPSGHSSASFAAASALLFARCRLWIPCGILAAVIAFSRLYLYVHFPTDVLAGSVLGIFCGFAAAVLLRRATQKKEQL